MLHLRALALLAAAPAAQAHTALPGVSPAHDPYVPWLYAALAVSALLYMAGAIRLWRHAGRGHGLRYRDVAFFALGWLVLVLALVSPLDALSDTLFSAHMVQHELLMVLAAPLLVLGRPFLAWTWALPRPWRHGVGATTRWRPLASCWLVVTAPLAAWAMHALALWAWHVPRYFSAALDDPLVHVLQHASFLFTALLFWWSVVSRGSRRGAGTALASVFTTMMHTSALGALLTFAPTAWYLHDARAEAWGLSALEDQQLGGLVMWVPGGFAYLAAGLAIAARYLRVAERRPILTPVQ